MYILKNLLGQWRIKNHLSTNGVQVSEKDTYITVEEYKELAEYAKSRNVKLSKFKKFSGDIETIKEAIDDIVRIASDFPEILKGRRSLELVLDFHSNDEDFATTVRHIIYLNANLYSSIEYFKEQYELSMKDGRFVADTDYRSVIRHETGHVVANIYRLKPMEIAKKILNTDDDFMVMRYIEEKLSFYATEYKDGREIISESFSGYYSHVGNEFADRFVEECLKIKGGSSNETS